MRDAPDFVWLTGYLEPSSSEITLNMRSESGEILAISPHLLSSLAQKRKDTAPPLLFLDISDDPNRGYQCLLRNRFADAIHRGGQFRSIVAAGLSDQSNLPAYLESIRRCVQSHTCEGEFAKLISQFCSYSPCLFAVDPTLPIL
jgi:hypothetical protein